MEGDIYIGAILGVDLHEHVWKLLLVLLAYTITAVHEQNTTIRHQIGESFLEPLIRRVSIDLLYRIENYNTLRSKYLNIESVGKFSHFFVHSSRIEYFTDTSGIQKFERVRI